ncbi:hypothetical protein BCF33_2440 [Hasllibacter halocynthiae]|uniref:Uncharacterized protein n=1 Tax=Hasllibacter halocynthiae TaxID=595589 RepID=A0A2T0X3S6_9RHOB|nr:hypothetical protein [Hasllibacter halocynthiae]PRY93567.1 hypothetical protein BCF33_2440 [Hasllibacter halocynthiae]
MVRGWISSLLSTAGLLLVGGLILVLAAGLGGVRETVPQPGGTAVIVTQWGHVLLIAALAVACFVGAWAVRR